MRHAWAFARAFDSARRERLEKFDDFDKVAEIICRRAQFAHAFVCEGNELGPQDCWRPVVMLDVGNEAFDAFFNSPGGYRAQYLSDPDSGQAANGRLLRALEPRLTDAVTKSCPENRLGPKRVGDAFLANSAKIWPDEKQLIVARATVDLAIDLWNQPCDWIQFPKNARL